MTKNEIMTKLSESYKNCTLMELPYVQTVIYTTRKDKTDGQRKNFYVNCETSERSFDLRDVVDVEKPFKMIQRKSNIFEGYAFGYDEELDLLVIFLAEIDTSMPKEGAKRRWNVYCRMYVDRDKRVYYKGWDNMYQCCDSIKICDDYGFLKMESSNCIVPDNCRLPEDPHFLYPDRPSMDAVWKIFPKVITLEANKTCAMSQKWWLCDFLRYKEPSRKDGKKQKMLDSFLRRRLSDPSSYQECTKKIMDEIHKKSGIDADVRVSVLERVQDGDSPVACLRKFFCSASVEDGMPHEFSRIYFTAKTALACKSDNKGGFVLCIYNHASYWGGRLIDYDPSITKGTMLEYFSTIVDTVPSEMKEFYIWTLLKMPVLEMLWKAGYDAYVRNILYRSRTSSPQKMFEYSFGKINQKKTSLHEIVGLNKHQLDVLLNMNCNTDTSYQYFRPMIHTIKKIVGAGRTPEAGGFISIKDINPRIFDAAVDIYKKVYEKCDAYESDAVWRVSIVNGCMQRIMDCVVFMCEIWGPGVLLKAKKGILLLCDDAVNEAKKQHDSDRITWISSRKNITVFMDYMGMVRDMDVKSSSNPYFKTLEELRRLHDNAVSILKIKEDEEQARMISKLSERVGKFEYKDDKYCVITPKCPADFLREGQMLGHCVGQYVGRVARGETNIMFIRKNLEYDKPFFTVEISDEGNIEQIHGSCNRNLDTEPDLIPFVKKWQEKCGVAENNINKVR